MSYSTFAFTEKGRAGFVAFLAQNLHQFDEHHERITRAYELNALRVFEGRGPGETLSYELRSTETRDRNPALYYPDVGNDLEETACLADDDDAPSP